MSQIPNKFINYFSNIAKELSSNITPVDTSFTSSLKNRTTNSFFMSNITHKEVDDAIDDMKHSGGGINKMSTTILK